MRCPLRLMQLLFNTGFQNNTAWALPRAGMRSDRKRHDQINDSADVSALLLLEPGVVASGLMSWFSLEPDGKRRGANRF